MVLNHYGVLASAVIDINCKHPHEYFFRQTNRITHEDFSICSLKTKSFDHGLIWRRGEVVITTAQLFSCKLELRLCAGSDPAYSMSEIRDDEHL